MKEVRKMFVQPIPVQRPELASGAAAGTVLKPFSTVNRRFKAGDVIPPDADLAPLGREVLVARGFIAG